MKRWWASLGLLILLALVLWWLRVWMGEDSGRAGDALVAEVTPDLWEAGVKPNQVAVGVLAPRPDQPRSPLADLLNHADAVLEEDLRVVLNLLQFYRERFGAYPTAGENAQVVNALAGNNPGRLAIIERSHEAVSVEGELLDRWGSPFFFHFISREQVEVRSAGPDLQMWTADDGLLAAGGPSEYSTAK